MSASSSFSLPKRLLLLVISFFMYVLAKTLRVKNDGATESFLRGEEHERNDSEASFILFWHNQLLLVFLVMIAYKKNFPPFYAMVTSNKDGNFLSAILEKFGYFIVRGSTNNKSLQALKGVHKAIKQKHSVFIAADGPTGPIYKFKPGAVFLSHKYQVPINLIHLKPSRCFRFKTWDRLMLPLPFSEVQFDWIKVGPEEFEITSNQANPKEGLDKSVAVLQDRMSSISA